MGTRCQIRIVKNGCPLNYYHHHDGGWNGVGAELRKWLKECGDDAEALVLRIMDDKQYQPTFFRHVDIELFYLLNFDENVFNGYELNGWDPWADEGEDDYDQHKPWYNQLPKQDCVAVVKSIVKT